MNSMIAITELAFRCASITELMTSTQLQWNTSASYDHISLVSEDELHKCHNWTNTQTNCHNWTKTQTNCHNWTNIQINCHDWTTIQTHWINIWHGSQKNTSTPYDSSILQNWNCQSCPPGTAASSSPLFTLLLAEYALSAHVTPHHIYTHIHICTKVGISYIIIIISKIQEGHAGMNNSLTWCLFTV